MKRLSRFDSSMNPILLEGCLKIQIGLPSWTSYLNRVKIEEAASGFF